jgi:hypothetical protein
MKFKTQAEQQLDTALTCLFLATDRGVALDILAKVNARVAELEHALDVARRLPNYSKEIARA